jgi:hypothetical protein
MSVKHIGREGHGLGLSGALPQPPTRLGHRKTVRVRIPANPITHSGNTRSEKRGVRMRFIFGFDEGKGL